MEANDPHTYEKLRPVGLLERYSTARHHLGFYHNVACTAYYYKEGQPVDLKILLYRALAEVIRQHPILSAIPINEDTATPDFVRLPQVDLDGAVSFIQRSIPFHGGHGDDERDIELDQVLQTQHNTSFKERYGELPFWRLIILYQPTGTEEESDVSLVSSKFAAVFVYHHALGDGGSGLAFHRSLHSALQSIPDTTDDCTAPAIIPASSTKLLPPLEAVHPLPGSFLFIAKALWGDMFPPSNRGVWVGNPITTAPVTTLVRTLVISPATTKKLVEVCRTHDITVTGVTQTVLAVALFQNIPPEWTKLQAQVATSFRRFLDPKVINDDMIGVWVSGFSDEYTRATLLPTTNNPQTSAGGKDAVDSAFWAEARRARANIQKRIDARGRNEYVSLLKWVRDIHEHMKKKVGKPRTVSYEMSNIGVLKVSPSPQAGSDGDGAKESWKVGRCVFSQCSPVAGSALEASVATGPDGALVWAFSWQEDVIEEDLVGNMMNTIKQRLQELVEN